MCHNIKEKVEAVLNTALGDKYRIEVIDLEKNLELAEEDQILAIPTLVKSILRPVVRLVGDLTDTEKVISHLTF